MVLLRNTLLASFFLLAGCAVKFDPVEHSRVVDIRHSVSLAQVQGHCSDPVLARRTAESVDRDAVWLVTYSEYIPNNDSMQRMSTELRRITLEFAQRYQQSTAPSKMYCELKLKNIASVVDVMQRTNARRAR